MLMIARFSLLHGSPLEFEFAAFKSRASLEIGTVSFLHRAVSGNTGPVLSCKVGGCSVSWSHKTMFGRGYEKLGDRGPG